MRRWLVVGLLVTFLLFAGCKKAPPKPVIPDHEEIVAASAGEEGIDLASQSLAELGGGTLTLSEGVFVIDAPIRLISNMILQGQGENTVIKLADGVNQDIKMIEGIGISNVTIRDLVVDGNRENNDESMQHGIYIQDSSNIKVLNVTVKNCWKLGLILSFDTYNCRGEGIDAYGNDLGIGVRSNNILTMSHVHHNRSGVVVEGRNIIISNNYIDNNSDTGIIQSRQPGENDNINISSNKIFDNKVGITINCDNSTIQNNEIFRNSTMGLVLLGEETNPVSSVSVLGNSFIGTGLILYSYCSNVSIQQNTIRIRDYEYPSLYGVDINSTVENTLVVNNDLYQSGTIAAIKNNGTNTNFGAGNRVNNGTWKVGVD